MDGAASQIRGEDCRLWRCLGFRQRGSLSRSVQRTSGRFLARTSNVANTPSARRPSLAPSRLSLTATVRAVVELARPGARERASLGLGGPEPDASSAREAASPAGFFVLT